MPRGEDSEEAFAKPKAQSKPLVNVVACCDRRHGTARGSATSTTSPALSYVRATTAVTPTTRLVTIPYNGDEAYLRGMSHRST